MPAAWGAPQGATFESADSEWLMANCKVLPCSNTCTRGHDWAKCPFAHVGEKFVRRDLRKHAYQSTMCPRMREVGGCPHGNACEYAHNVFEYWMHPTRFRTQMCAYGANCGRTVCFFAHSVEQLRTPSAALTPQLPLPQAPLPTTVLPTTVRPTKMLPTTGTSSPVNLSSTSLFTLPAAWHDVTCTTTTTTSHSAPFVLQGADWLSAQDNTWECAAAGSSGTSSPPCEPCTLSLAHDSAAASGLLPAANDGAVVMDLFASELMAAAEVGKKQEETIQQQQDTIQALVMLLDAALGRQGLAR